MWMMNRSIPCSCPCWHQCLDRTLAKAVRVVQVAGETLTAPYAAPRDAPRARPCSLTIIFTSPKDSRHKYAKAILHIRQRSKPRYTCTRSLQGSRTPPDASTRKRKHRNVHVPKAKRHANHAECKEKRDHTPRESGLWARLRSRATRAPRHPAARLTYSDRLGAAREFSQYSCESFILAMPTHFVRKSEGFSSSFTFTSLASP